MKAYDIIIVGAGPAGATLGYEMGRRGLSALILERERLPRYKPCAGGITARAAGLLDFDIGELAERVVYGARITYRLGDEYVKRHKEPLIYTVMRSDFDNRLVQRACEAGAEVMDGVRATQLGLGPSGAKVITNAGSFEGRIVAGADGARGMVAAHSGLTRDVDLDLALQAEVSVPDSQLARWESLVGLDFGQLPGGYGWVFPKREHLSVGVGGPLRSARRLRPYLERLLGRLGEYSMATLAGHLMPLRRRRMAIQGGNVLLLGDAAGLIHPLTGEGIYYAISSARLAAPVVESALRGGDIDLSAYRDAVDSRLMPGIDIGRFLLNLFEKSPRFYLNLARRSDLFWERVCQVLLGARPSCA